MVFPGNRIDKKMTINQARGCHPRIRDRFDLTVEFIRLHCVGALDLRLARGQVPPTLALVRPVLQALRRQGGG